MQIRRASGGLKELLVSPGQGVAVGAEAGCAGEKYPGAVQIFQAMLKQRAIMFIQDVLTDVDGVVRRHAEQEAVEGGVVEFAQRQTVGDLRLTAWISIGDDVSGVQQFAAAQA